MDLLGFMGFKGIYRDCRDLWEFLGIHWDLLGFIGIYGDLWGFMGIYEDL